MNTRKPIITFTTDPDGTEIALVPIGKREGRAAEIHAADLQELDRQGVSRCWYFKTASGRGYVNAHDPDHLGGNRTIARLITGAGRGQSVKYRDGNRLNLRRSNLCLVESGNARGQTPKTGSDLCQPSEAPYDYA